MLGVGLSHPVSTRIDLTGYLQYEQKGNRTELNVPLNPVNDDSRVIINSEYSYRYLTFSIVPQIKMGERKRFIIGFGLYVSRINEIKGYDRTHVLRDNTIEEGHFEARLFRNLRNDGGVNSFTWMNGLTGIEREDYGAMLSIDYFIPINRSQSLIIRLADNFGLRNINKDNPYSLEEKNHTASLIVAYILQRSIKK